ncbi:sodium/proline symporter PutP [Bartonella sp. DGB1]|uniref:sodium/proline symporter PutP n=1 Tax=Bartonella sp. DGB1 TaxID=3239807 RepID=UPI0035265799
MDIITASTPMIITFSIYLIAMVTIGILAYYLTTNFNDYILGGRKIGSIVTALSAGASDMSAWLLLGLPGAFYLLGFSEVWIAVGLLVGAWCNWQFIAARLRIYTEIARNALTIPDYFTHRFNDSKRVLSIISSLVILLFFTIYCASGISAGAQIFHTTFGFSYLNALFLGASVTILYTFLGGFLAVSWTDAIQATLMLFALIVTPVLIIIYMGGFSEVSEIMYSNFPNHNNLMPTGGYIAIISSLGWGLGYFGQPHILSRFMAASSIPTINRAKKIGLTWMALCLVGAMAIGYLGLAYLTKNPQLAGSVVHNPERIFIQLSMVLFNPWMAGVILSAILAAVMSTLSSQLLICSSSLTQDFYKNFLRPSACQKELVLVSRFMVLMVAMIACILALNPNNSILSLVSYAWAGLGASFGPVILLSLTWKKMTRNGALAGMIVGAATVVIWKSFAWLGLYELIPAFIISILAIVIVSLLEKNPDPQLEKIFIESNQKFNE